MRILVTGGSGFIGSNLVHHLLHGRGGVDADCCPDQDLYGGVQGASDDVTLVNLDALTYAADPRNTAGIDASPAYRFVEGDIQDAALVDQVMQDLQPDVVLHLAAESHVDRSIDDGGVFVRTNVVGTQTLLDAARRHDVGHFIHVSTDEVYGSLETGSADEDAPLAPSSPYSASKAGSDLLALAHHHTYGLPVTVTRCTNNFGPRQHPEKLVPKMITRALAGETLPVYGTGKNVRDWLYVRDHCTALELLTERKGDGEVFNIAAGDERSNLEILDAILDLTGASSDLIEHVADRPGHDWRYSLDDHRLRALGWTPQTSFQDGLKRTLDWLKVVA